MAASEVYLYGMTLMTTSHRLAAGFPQPDSYSEIAESHRLPGGETGTCAVVLDSLGLGVLLDGNHLGHNTYRALLDFFEGTSVSMELMTYDPDFEGLEDIVFIDKDTRTAFGKFVEFYADRSLRRWNAPSERAIREAKVVGLDPFFFEESLEAARLCNEHDRKFATIDCPANSDIHGWAEVTVLSHEFLRREYSGEDFTALFAKYAERTAGLVIFTFGSQELWFGRAGQGISKHAPFRVDVQSTLGAGDAFKAGVIYALARGMDDATLVRFASATAAAACTRYPLARHPPTLARIAAIAGEFG